MDVVMFRSSSLKKDEQEKNGGTNHWSSWRYTLERCLRMPQVSDGGGIRSCIRDALECDPSKLARKSRMDYNPGGSSKPMDIDVNPCEVKKQSGVLGSTSSCSIAGGNNGMSISDANSTLCRNALLDVLVSEKFALFCDLLFRTFQQNKSNTLIDFSMINSRMKNGHYAASPGTFNNDMQQIFENFEEVGSQMVHLARSLSTMSQASYQKQAGGISEVVAGEHKTEDNCLIGLESKNPKDSTTTVQLTTCDSAHSANPDQTEACGLYKSCACKHCGTEANGQGSLICDGCEAMYHFSCIKPAIKEIPTQSWYCSLCRIKRTKSAGDPSDHVHHDSLHENCAVCDRLEVVSKPLDLPESGSRTQLADDSVESSVSSMGEDEKPDLSTTARACLCKHCGSCEDDDRKFIICGHDYCPFKFYHIRCLRSSQMASSQQKNRPCWYCPSCLCRSCFRDKDDDLIVLCDGCDEAYHTYCMKPPRTSIPKGQWYCMSCNVERARDGMRKYEYSILQLHGNVLGASEKTKESKVSPLVGAEK